MKTNKTSSPLFITPTAKDVAEIIASDTTKASLVDGKVPEAQLPSYVDDVLEFEGMSTFPAEGETGKIYVALDSNFTYRWSGSAYVRVGGGDTAGLVDTETLHTAIQEAVANLGDVVVAADIAGMAKTSDLAGLASENSVDNKIAVAVSGLASENTVDSKIATALAGFDGSVSEEDFNALADRVGINENDIGDIKTDLGDCVKGSDAIVPVVASITAEKPAPIVIWKYTEEELAIRRAELEDKEPQPYLVTLNNLSSDQVSILADNINNCLADYNAPQSEISNEQSEISNDTPQNEADSLPLFFTTVPQPIPDVFIKLYRDNITFGLIAMVPGDRAGWLVDGVQSMNFQVPATIPYPYSSGHGLACKLPLGYVDDNAAENANIELGTWLVTLPVYVDDNATYGPLQDWYRVQTKKEVNSFQFEVGMLEESREVD